MAQLIVDTNKLLHNIKFILKCSDRFQLELVAVLKGVNAFPGILNAFMNAGVNQIGVSKIETAKKMAEHFAKKPICMSLPAPSSATGIIRYFCASLNSELHTISALGEAARKESTTHDIILMVDVGDLREGVMPENVLPFVASILDLKNKGINIKGLGANFGCCCGLIPDEKSIAVLPSLAKDIEQRFGIRIDTVSVGGSVLLDFLEQNTLPSRINQIRIGESILLGRIPCVNRVHENLHQDVFKLRGRILEIKEKPSFPTGRTGLNAFGKKLEIKDMGNRRRAIVDIGVANTNPSGIKPLDDSLHIVCSNTDYTILDVHDSGIRLNPGDIIEFSLNYESLSHCLISPFTRIIMSGDHA